VIGALSAVTVLLGAIPPFASRLTPDTSWYLYAADHMLRGARPYVDLVEANPPLILWLNTIPVTIAHLFAVSSGTIFNAMVVGLAVVSVWWCVIILRGIFPEASPLRHVMVLLLLFALFPLSREDFGEREHLFLMLVLPYVLLTVRWISGDEPGPRGSLLAGLAAGVGIALKPYFIVLWVALEALVLLHRRSGRPWLRLETAMIVTVGLVYLLTVVFWARGYFDVVRTMGGAYYQFMHNSLATTALLGDGAQLPVVSLVAYLGLRSEARHRESWSVLACATAALWVAAVLQHKGWRYHFYPALCLGLLLLGLIVLDRQPKAGRLRRLYAGVATVALWGVVLVTTAACVRQLADPRNPRYDSDPDVSRLVPIVARAAGHHVLMLSWSAASAFPLMMYAGVENASRFNHLWILAAEYWHELWQAAPIRYRTRDEMAPLERWFVDAVVEDVERTAPTMILALRPGPDRRPYGPRRLDFIEYFLRDRRFAQIFQRYTFEGQVGEYWIFRLAPPGTPTVPPPARPALLPPPITR
jgi:hypothetical protein